MKLQVANLVINILHMKNKKIKLIMISYNREKSNNELTAGCKAIMAKMKARIKVMVMKKTLIPQSCPDGVKK